MSKPFPIPGVNLRFRQSHILDDRIREEFGVWRPKAGRVFHGNPPDVDQLEAWQNYVGKHGNTRIYTRFHILF